MRNLWLNLDAISSIEFKESDFFNCYISYKNKENMDFFGNNESLLIKEFLDKYIPFPSLI